MLKRWMAGGLLGALLSMVLSGVWTPMQAISAGTLLSEGGREQPTLLAVRRLLDFLKRKPRVRTYAAGSRGGFCPVTPHNDVVPDMPHDAADQKRKEEGKKPWSRQVWSNRPLLVWQGSSQAIEVRKASDKSLLWRQVVKLSRPGALNLALYAGPKLEPGETYEWWFFKAKGSLQPTYTVTFQMIDASAHGPLTRKLLREDVAAQQLGLSREEQVLKRLAVFEQEGLWLDMLQEMVLALAREQLTDEVEPLLQKEILRLCGENSREFDSLNF